MENAIKCKSGNDKATDNKNRIFEYSSDKLKNVIKYPYQKKTYKFKERNLH